MTDELAVVPPETDIDLSTLTREKVLAGVDEALARLAETGDIQTAVRVLDTFARFEDISGFARAKFLWGSFQWFTTTQQEGDFYEKFGISDKNNKVYVDRLIRLWEQLQSGAVPKRIAKKSIRELTPITEALSQGYEFSADDWKEIEKAADNEEIWAYIQHNVKKKETRSHAIRITVDGDGTITAWKQNTPHFVGSLNFQERNDDPVIDAAILRIIKSTRIKEEKK